MERNTARAEVPMVKETVESLVIHFASSKKDTSNRSNHNKHMGTDSSRRVQEGKPTTLGRSPTSSSRTVKVTAPTSLRTAKPAMYALICYNTRE